MKDKEPSRERRLFDDCMHCNERYELTADNTKLVMHLEQPECDYLYMVCDACELPTKMFVGEDTVEMAIARDIPTRVEKYADTTTYAQWLELYDIKLLEPHELTSHEEHLVEFVHFLIEDNHLLEEFDGEGDIYL